MKAARTVWYFIFAAVIFVFLQGCSMSHKQAGYSHECGPMNIDSDIIKINEIMSVAIDDLDKKKFMSCFRNMEVGYAYIATLKADREYVAEFIGATFLYIYFNSNNYRLFCDCIIGLKQRSMAEHENGYNLCAIQSLSSASVILGEAMTHYQDPVQMNELAGLKNKIEKLKETF